MYILPKNSVFIFLYTHYLKKVIVFQWAILNIFSSKIICLKQSVILASFTIYSTLKPPLGFLFLINIICNDVFACCAQIFFWKYLLWPGSYLLQRTNHALLWYFSDISWFFFGDIFLIFPDMSYKNIPYRVFFFHWASP